MTIIPPLCALILCVPYAHAETVDESLGSETRTNFPHYDSLRHRAEELWAEDQPKKGGVLVLVPPESALRPAAEKLAVYRKAQIVTYSTINAKAALKDSARVLGHPFAVGEKLTKAMPPAVMGKDIPLSGIFDESHPRHKVAGDFRALYESEEDLREVVDTARGLEGLRRQWGVHAAGVIL